MSRRFENPFLGYRTPDVKEMISPEVKHQARVEAELHGELVSEVKTQLASKESVVSFYLGQLPVLIDITPNFLGQLGNRPSTISREDFIIDAIVTGLNQSVVEVFDDPAEMSIRFARLDHKETGNTCIEVTNNPDTFL